MPPPPAPAPARLPPPPWPSTFATAWIVDTIAGDDALDFSLLQALVRASSEQLAGAPEATRKRLALRSLLELSSLIPAPAGGDADAAVKARVEGAQSAEAALFRVVREVERSGKLEKDLLPLFNQETHKTICTNKLTLPQTSVQLLEEVDPWIRSPTQHFQLEQNATVTLGFNRTSNVLPTDAPESGHLPEFITAQDTNMISQPDSREAHLNALQHERGEKVNQDLEDVSASIWPVEKDHVHGDLTLQSAGVLLSVSCNGANQGSKSETNLQPGAAAEDLSQQDLCIKCGKDGQLLECSGCSLAAHDSCFGSSVTFEGTDLFYCPRCCYKKATEAYEKAKKTYYEAREKLAAFHGTEHVSKQHDEQLNGVQPGAPSRDGHSNGCDTSKRNNIHQNEAYHLDRQDEEPHQLRKKQKVSARGNGYPKEVLTEKVPFQSSCLASMNKHSVLQNNSKTPVEDAEKKQQVGDRDDELEATDAGKRSLPPWRNMRPSKSRKGTAKQGQHVATSPRKRSSVHRHPQKRNSNPVAPTRRERMAWSGAEEAMLREAMAKFAPENDAPIPWVRILGYGRSVFDMARLASDLRVKWRNMQKK
ncbi:hypothetical protein BDA96_04G002100 [Sorghum bicolor]|uniref:PHD-type domain-containing protein n=2 Tax=Sorghum bicolor TaxID=4558 RepID=A0A921R0S3_SORBI|nr:uncharacterized protein LOC8066471 [Sorghum bicolor]EES04316.2 hypothetical protein SORBI_3004G001900 [Sorghum bicolor]KAG0531183.1 hypothetical protein BDA96_04G002100 [Sorghum bicolor]|eukprot:XP_002451340.2 uncharacterized protein LOC8066471 [Sorghum bicolor]